MKFSRLSALLFAAVLSSSCGTVIPNIEAVSPIEIKELPNVAASGQWTNTDQQRLLDHDEWFDFLYAQPERPDPKNPGKSLPAKGPAVCVSSEHWAKNETAIAQLCIHGKCTYDQQQAAVRALRYRSRSLRANSRRIGKPVAAMLAENERLLAQVLAARTLPE
jgi:hypothetical protein